MTISLDKPAQIHSKLAPTYHPVFYRTYSRRGSDGHREDWDEMCDRTIEHLAELGKFSHEERRLIGRMQRSRLAMPSGRWLWVGGTDWIKKPENYPGAFNCTSNEIIDWRSFGLLMDLAMMGCGTGAVLEPRCIEQLPVIRNILRVVVLRDVGAVAPSDRQDDTTFIVSENGEAITITVGDSRQGWVSAYQSLLELSSDERLDTHVAVLIDLGNVRPPGERLKGFGGTSDPVKLTDLFKRCAAVLAGAVGRKLSAVECCLLIDEAAACVVAGNVRRSAGMRQFSQFDEEAATAKDNLWKQDANGGWSIDPNKDALRMANHTRIFHTRPSLEEVTEAVRKQFFSGEGAIQWAGEVVARANADLLSTRIEKVHFIHLYNEDISKAQLYLEALAEADGVECSDAEINHRMRRYGLNPCLAGDTLIPVKGLGLMRISELSESGTPVPVKDGDGNWTNSIPRKTGVKERLLKVTLSDGSEYAVTPRHDFVKVDGSKIAAEDMSQGLELKSASPLNVHGSIHNPSDAYLDAWLIADGTWHGRNRDRSKLYLYEPKFDHEPQLVAVGAKFKDSSSKQQVRKAAYFNDRTLLPKDRIPAYVLQGDLETKLAFIDGYLQSDGTESITSKGWIVQVTSIHKSFLIELQALLRTVGVHGKISVSHEQEQKMLPKNDGTGESYLCNCKTAYRLTVSNPLALFELIRPDRVKRGAYSKGRPIFVQSVELSDRVEDVYCFNVPTTHSFDLPTVHSGNCGEIASSDFFCMSGETMIITEEGLSPIKDLIGENVSVWNGKRWSKVTPFMTGKNRQLYRVTFTDGTHLDATENHRWFIKDRFQRNYSEVLTKDLDGFSKYSVHTQPFEIEYDKGIAQNLSWAYTLGFAVGDGHESNGKTYLTLYGEQKTSLDFCGEKYERNRRTSLKECDYQGSLRVVKNMGFTGALLTNLKEKPESLHTLAAWNKKSILSFVAGLADADGSNTDSGGIRIYLSDYDRAYALYLLLVKCGIRSSVNLVQKKGAVTNYGPRGKDLWYLQITDCASIPCQRLNVSNGHKPKAKGKNQVIKSVELLPGFHNTYCFNEPEFHKGVFGGTLAGNCNLSEVHLNQLDPSDERTQASAFKAGALAVAALLQQNFIEPRHQRSRDFDPIVGVSFTGLFDFFVKAFGVEWLQWWEAGRPDTAQGIYFKEKESAYLSRWQQIVNRTVWEYCDKHGLKRPNRCTTVQPAGTKSLLTGASPGWHPPKAQRFIRRITFRKDDPVALACIDYGYSVIPSQSDKDEKGNLLNDPFDPRCTEWLVELPVAVEWADLPGADSIEIEKFSALAQFDFYMQVQKHYAGHNVSATIELRQAEIEPLAERIHQAIANDEGYISAALLARFDDTQTFPRLPFEPISKGRYEEMLNEVHSRQINSDFHAALESHDAGELVEAGPAGCDSDKCMMPEAKPK